MKYRNKLEQQQAEATQLNSQHLSAGQVREFAHADELLRHDSLHTPVPPTLACRLRESIGPVSEKPRTWWRRLLGL
jgi:hypothetical protein